jgi:peptidoglycan/LPS O-acetylase OafA/YrhL
MIQRSQTLYLLLAAITVFLLFIFPIAELVDKASSIYIFRYRGFYEVVDGAEKLINLTIPLAILLFVSAILPLIIIFLYKKRKLQMKLCIFNIILVFCALGLIAFYVAASYSKIEANVQYKVSASLPIIAIILIVMAYLGIKKDDKLIKSIDRIR